MKLPILRHTWRTPAALAAAAIAVAGVLTAAAVGPGTTTDTSPVAYNARPSQGGCQTYDARGLSGFNIGVCINDRATGTTAYPDIYVNTTRQLGVRETCRIDIETWDDNNHKLGDTATDCALGPHTAKPVTPNSTATAHTFARLWFDGSSYWTGDSPAVSLAPNASSPVVDPAPLVHALTFFAGPGVKVYRAPDLSGTPLGTINNTNVTATCRTPGIGIQILYPAGTAGIGYIAAPPTMPGNLIACPAPPANKTGNTGQSTAAQCAAREPNEVLFSEFIKNWILNNADTWASDLSALGDTNPPTSNSQIVADALAKASSSLYDENSAFASAVKSVLEQESLTTYPDCNDQADGEQAQWKKDLFNRLADQVTHGLLKAALQQIENAIADLDQACGTRVQPGQIYYGPAGPGGRATIGVACLTPEDLTRGSATTEASRYATAGYQAGRDRATAEHEAPNLTINACHLIGDQLGGSGTDTRNLVTCTRAANAFSIGGVQVLNPNMLTYENRVRAAVGTRGQTVAYVVFPEYDGGNVIPYAIKMSAVCVANCTNNPININGTIQNELWSRAQNAWVNIGR